MEKTRKQYRMIIIGILVVMGLILSGLYVYFLSQIQETYQRYASQSILDAKKTFLEDTVNNVIGRIGQIKAEEQLRLGFDHPDVDEAVKRRIYLEIHGYQFSNDAYIWVNEVIDYAGGADYAIRRIHPNMKDTEGMYLSTDMTDIAGNLPYLTELEGIKEDGELFFNYFFKKKDCDVVSEKITYAKLYEEYDWIIAMGVHLDDVQAYVTQSTEASKEQIRQVLFFVVAMTAVLIATAMLLLSYLERWYFKHTNIVLKSEAYKDPLTGVFNRRAGELELKKAFEEYRLLGDASAVFMLDIDDFKKINDKYGHDRGDAVLRTIADDLNKHIRNTDILSRWGGEEFLLICHGLKQEDIAPFTDKLLRVVRDASPGCGLHTVNEMITISIGVSAFIAEDGIAQDAVKRADKALYQAKALGKNRAVLLLSGEDTQAG